MQMIVKYIFWVLVGLSLLFVGWLFLRIFICEQFIIPSDLMTPTLISGDRILVNKLIFGARIYKKNEFAKDIQLHSFRVQGVRNLQVNDVVVFNVPHGCGRSCLESQINYVYSIRCVDTPCDSVSIHNEYLHNNRHSNAIGNLSQQHHLSEMQDSLIPSNILMTMSFSKCNLGWTIKKIGPLYVPQTGATIGLDICNYKLYKHIIEYGRDGLLKCIDSQTWLDNSVAFEYTFLNDYYFFCGDNIFNSNDSRYWGFVPEKFIIDIVKRICFSKNYYTGERHLDRYWREVK